MISEFPEFLFFIAAFVMAIVPKDDRPLVLRFLATEEGRVLLVPADHRGAKKAAFDTLHAEINAVRREQGRDVIKRHTLEQYVRRWLHAYDVKYHLDPTHDCPDFEQLQQVKMALDDDMHGSDEEGQDEDSGSSEDGIVLHADEMSSQEEIAHDLQGSPSPIKHDPSMDPLALWYHRQYMLEEEQVVDEADILAQDALEMSPDAEYNMPKPAVTLFDETCAKKRQEFLDFCLNQGLTVQEISTYLHMLESFQW